MSQGIGEVGSSGNVSSVGSLGTCTSVNFIFAKLQMELAAAAKDSALDYIEQVEKAQADQKEVADMMGISQSYISRLEKKIINRLRREINRME